MSECRAFLSISNELGSMANPCNICGHTMTAHPGFHNTAIISCALCDLEELIKEARQAMNWMLEP